MEALVWLFWLGLIVWGIFSWSNNKKKKQFAEIARKRAQIDQLPPFHFYAKPDTTWNKIQNFGASEKNLLSEVSFGQGYIRLVNIRGQVLYAPLIGMFVQFYRRYGVTTYTIKSPNGNMIFYGTGNFSEQEWGVINYALSLAGRTDGAPAATNLEKGLGVAKTIMTIMKHM